MLKIKGRATGELDIKRAYLPGIVASSQCPTCGVTRETDFADNYLSYPEMNTVIALSFYCGDCEDAGRRPTDWTEEVVLEVRLRKPKSGEASTRMETVVQSEESDG